MATHTVTVMTAIENQVQHNRKTYDNIVAEHGEDAARLAWEALRIQLKLEATERQSFAEPPALGEVIEALGAMIFELELATGGQVSYDE